MADLHYFCRHVSYPYSLVPVQTLTHDSNAAIFPVVYFFYPETTRRSLEEMDRIFRKTKSIFSVVQVARDEPHMYSKKGELLLTLDDVEDDAVRRASVLSHAHKGTGSNSDENTSSERVEHTEKA